MDGINRDRKKIEADMREQAWEALDEISMKTEDLPPGICLFDDRWHQGVVGIIASRIKDKFHRPSIAFAQVDGSEELKGSARSVKGFHIRDALDQVATKNPGLINKFGGHAMAAGLSLNKNDFEAFDHAFTEEVGRLLDEDQLKARVFSDGWVEAKWLNLQVAYLIEEAGPWGQEFPEPLFDGRFNLVQHRKVGENHLKMMLSPTDDPSGTLDAIAFNVEAGHWPDQNSSEIEITYRIETNHFQGNISLQLVVEHILSIR